MASTDVVPKPPASPRPPDNRPSSPLQPAHKQILTVEHVQQVVELMKAIIAPPAPEDTTKTEEAPGGEQAANTRASKLEFKTVNEIWDAKTYKYKIAESSKPSDELADLDQYVSIVRQRVDKKTIDPIYYINIKLEGLRDILRIVL
ncbi:hypothetical protein OEA41_010186 [Lepraria neglecta]|uniref:Uncharacterized protein n=1 Tax=Lepraria neglecta TaxID=209136 RepID=A0AAD9YXB6_9LECA|nr:hypothetical protein OEA41_010186 [Lepraria neglecta]